MRWQRDWRRRARVIEDHAVSRERIEMRGTGIRTAISADAICARRIERDDDEVQRVTLDTARQPPEIGAFRPNVARPEAVGPHRRACDAQQRNQDEQRLRWDESPGRCNGGLHHDSTCWIRWSEVRDPRGRARSELDG